MPHAHTTDIVAALRQKGLRHTPVRDALIDALAKLPHGTDVPTLVETLKQRGFAVNKTTVYRQISTLVSSGVVVTMHAFDGVMRYELAHDEHHHHFVCATCRRVEPLAAAAVEDELATLERSLAQRGFRVASHALELFGTCPKCR